MAVTADVTRRIPAGWYPDRNDRSRRQWFNGTDWTDYFSPVPTRPLQIVPDLVEVEAQRPVAVVAPEPGTTTRRSLRGAITFHDRFPAFLLVGLIVANGVLLLVVLHFV